MKSNKATSRPQRRLTKADKDERSRSSTSPGYQPDPKAQHADSVPVRASYESLVLSKESRQMLREQLTATFPETISPAESRDSHVSKWPSRDSLTCFNMARKDKVAKTLPTLSVNEVAEDKPALSPSLSFHTARGRLSTHTESTIDVEAAINLLQELKKKASPEELVALHRALLPVKEIDTTSDLGEHNHQLASEYRKQFATRRRSNLPPGLATRGGPEDDPLRRHGEILRRPVPHVARPDATRASALAARTERPTTPDDSAHGQAGVYRPGTLRVTNGSASPASSIHFRDSFEIQDAKEVTLLHTTVASTYKIGMDVLDIDSSSDDTHSSTPACYDDIYAESSAIETTQIVLEPPANTMNNAMQEYSEFGGSPYDRKVSSQSSASASSGDQSIEQQFITPKASMADFATNVEPPVPLLQVPVRPEIGHLDSGYASEGSSNLRKETPEREENRPPVKPRPLEDQRWLTAIPKIEPNATSARYSLYTFDQVLKSSSTIRAYQSSPLSAEEAPSPHSAKGSVSKRQSLFSSLGRSKNQSTKMLAEPSVLFETAAPASIPVAAPVEEAAAKVTTKKTKSKKLKKAVPYHIRQARKELRRFEENAAAESAPSVETSGHSALVEQVDGDTQTQQPQNPVEDTFRMHAPHAYARIQAAGTAMQQHQAKSLAESEAALQHAQPRELQSSLSNAMSDDTDGTSIINFRAVARSLGASPYDISTSQFKSSIDYISGSENKWRIQSPFEIGQGIPPKTLGMDEKAASELARKKSRDYAEPENASCPEKTAPADTPRPQGPRRPYSTDGRHLPPMPEMPRDIENKARRADEMVTRRLGDSRGHTQTPPTPPRDSSLPLQAKGECHAVEHKLPMSEHVNDALEASVGAALDWTAQAKLWRERRQALQQPDEQQPQVLAEVDARRRPLSAPSKDQTLRIEIDRAASVSPAQMTLNNARIAMHERMSSPVSPLGKSKLESGSQIALSPVSDLSVSPSRSPALQAPRPPRPPTGIALANTNGRFPAEYLSMLNGSTSTLTSRPNSAHSTTPDRYSGGLQYEWHRGVGISGSAGTRTTAPEGIERSMPSKVVYGLDLSDVPIFLTKQVK